MAKGKQYFMVITDGENIEFYPHIQEGLDEIFSMYNNKSARFFDITIHSEFKAIYSMGQKRFDNPPCFKGTGDD